MKKLALVAIAFSGLSLAICATSQATPQDDNQFAFAQASCAANEVAPSDPRYSGCIDAFRLAVEFAAPQAAVPLMKKQLQKADTDCAANNVRSSDPHWGECVNNYLQSYYRYQITRGPDGLLHIMCMPRPSAVSRLRAILPLSLESSVTISTVKSPGRSFRFTTSCT